MKTTLLSIAVLGISAQSIAQDVIYEAKIEQNKVPEVIISSLERDFPGYSVVRYSSNPMEFVEGDVVLNRDVLSAENYDAYDISLMGKGKELVTTYDRNGKLIYTSEHLKQFTPPASIRNAITEAYPGWTLEQDTYTMVHYTRGEKKEWYRMILSKDGHRIKVFTDGSGKILNHPKMS